MAEIMTPAATPTGALTLPLPALGMLSDAHRRGSRCAWCSTPLTAETAVDAGERDAEDGSRIFPRGCADCAGRAAYRLLFDHATACNRCRTDASCPVAVAAQRLMRGGR
ncbi:hypothetical protein [Streptomyces sp. I4(2020)]|uniref:hypothetical protein n=1 Tax=Streptomyces sp. I4(2020) TaxID=2760981 RepID=UPI0018EE8EF8|nr:hypothetical protein [Streptomyces sp. I4(2020)]MBJ6615572.1 hypothetical protein [Streptomyces sp. I3(2020)]MBJ6626071.1 hypothetical protein [Streptomyces sp. I4(2020)]